MNYYTLLRASILENLLCFHRLALNRLKREFSCKENETKHISVVHNYIFGICGSLTWSCYTFRIVCVCVCVCWIPCSNLNIANLILQSNDYFPGMRFASGIGQRTSHNCSIGQFFYEAFIFIKLRMLISNCNFPINMSCCLQELYTNGRFGFWPIQVMMLECFICKCLLHTNEYESKLILKCRKRLQN